MNLIFQLIIAAILVSALLALERRKYMIHGIIMTCCIALHTIAIFAIMVPSLLSLHSLLSNLSTRLSLLVTTHAAAGSVVEILGVWLVAAWISNRKKTGDCFRRKHIMEITITLWILEIILGVYVYMTLYPLI